MSQKKSVLDGLDLDGLLAEGLSEAPVKAPVNWEPPTPGELKGVLPRYEITRLIGRGGMGAVYEARQLDLDRRVAIKLLPAELSGNEAFAARFQREARTMGGLRHPNILPVFEFGQTAADHWYFSMEYAEAGDLGARLSQGPLPPGEALRLVQEICSALETAHAEGVIHRDIKPSNILLTPDGMAKVTDFGLAVLSDRPQERLTHSGVAVGTFEYAAPEQAAGGAADARSDLYSVGVLLYELLTNKLPRGVFDPPSRVNPAVNPAMDAVVLTAMQNDPARRYQSATELRVAIRRAGNASPQPHGRWVILAAILLVFALGAGGWAWSKHQRQRVVAPSPEDTRVVSWGVRSFSQTGPPPDLRDAETLAVGFYHVLALRRDGTVIAWGSNVNGQRDVPAGLRDVRAVAAGADHSVALRRDGTVVAWGNNHLGQTDVPAGLSGVTAIAAGWRHTVALKEDGTVVVWGGNEWGQRNVPAGLADVRAISAGNAHTLALRRDGTLAAWGDNAHGQSTVPEGLTNVVSIAAGSFHNVVIRDDGSFAAWGNNQSDQTKLPPQLGKGKLVSAGYRHTVALLRDGSIIAWGDNLYGQCNVPPGLSNVVAIGTGFRDCWAVVAPGPATPSAANRAR